MPAVQYLARYTSASISAISLNTGNATQIADTLDATRTQDFSYDLLYRLTEADGAYGDIDYAYDAVHNRTSCSITTTGTVTETYSIDSFSNRLSSVDDDSNTRSFTYTAAGNITSDDRGAGSDHAFLYNAANRLEEVQRNSLTEASYLYNALGERILRSAWLPGSVTSTTTSRAA